VQQLVIIFFVKSCSGIIVAETCSLRLCLCPTLSIFNTKVHNDLPCVSGVFRGMVRCPLFLWRDNTKICRFVRFPVTEWSNISLSLNV